jgi:hypothetical protein
LSIIPGFTAGSSSGSGAGESRQSTDAFSLADVVHSLRQHARVACAGICTVRSERMLMSSSPRILIDSYAARSLLKEYENSRVAARGLEAAKKARAIESGSGWKQPHFPRQ